MIDLFHLCLIFTHLLVVFLQLKVTFRPNDNDFTKWGKRGAPVEKGKGPIAKKCCYNKTINEILFGEENMKTR
jgi:hypothetical protein